MVKVTVSIPSLPDGTPVGVTNLPAELFNNTTVEVSDEAIADYEKRSGRKFADLLKSKKFSTTKSTHAHTKPNADEVKEGAKV